MKVAFDVDGTIIDANDAPRQEVLRSIKEHCLLGDEVWIWSGGGKDYAESISRKIKLEDDDDIKISGYLSKLDNDGSFDVAYDDQNVQLAKINIQV